MTDEFIIDDNEHFKEYEDILKKIKSSDED